MLDLLPQHAAIADISDGIFDFSADEFKHA